MKYIFYIFNCDCVLFIVVQYSTYVTNININRLQGKVMKNADTKMLEV